MRFVAFPLLVVCCVLFGHGLPLEACTAFHAADGTRVLVGNNEDVPEDLAQAWSGTHMWFVPATAGTYGKVSFGFGEGCPFGPQFAQGGMNEAGLFFDYFSTPFLEITGSLTKPVYDGVIADKALDEFSTVGEALLLFDQYNLQAQLFETCQIMFGDALGASAVIEGDLTIPRSDWYQASTNFYQSAPEQGGFPCPRYEAVTSLLAGSSGISTELCRTALDAAHVEGPSTTQYSIVYDLESRRFRVFFHHNFEELIDIDLQTELAKGPASYPLASLFAGLRPSAPDDGATAAPLSVTFRWSGKPDCDYRLHCSTNPDFAGCDPILVGKRSGSSTGSGPLGLLLLGLIPLCLFRRPLVLPALALLALLAIPLASCGSGGSDSAPADGELSCTVHCLEPDTTHYWKVTAQASPAFESETVVRTFTTSAR